MALRSDHGRDEEPVEISEMNVTPFVDVMLVLLIVFMVAAPLSTVDVPVELPGSTARPGQKTADPIHLTLAPDLSLSLGPSPVARPMLATALDALTGGDRETMVHLRADRSVSYGDLTEVMNLLRDAGYLKVALVGAEATPTPAPSVPG